MEADAFDPTPFVLSVRWCQPNWQQHLRCILHRFLSCMSENSYNTGPESHVHHASHISIKTEPIHFDFNIWRCLSSNMQAFALANFPILGSITRFQRLIDFFSMSFLHTLLFSSGCRTRFWPRLKLSVTASFYANTREICFILLSTKDGELVRTSPCWVAELLKISRLPFGTSPPKVDCLLCNNCVLRGLDSGCPVVRDHRWRVMKWNGLPFKYRLSPPRIRFLQIRSSYTRALSHLSISSKRPDLGLTLQGISGDGGARYWIHYLPREPCLGLHVIDGELAVAWILVVPHAPHAVRRSARAKSADKEINFWCSNLCSSTKV